MRRDDLERRVIHFVVRLADGVGAVEPETALFEEGVIDSLRILDLIAFVETVTGSKVPDAEVRLENFRSARAIAAAFAEDGAGRRSGRRGTPARIAAGAGASPAVSGPTDGGSPPLRIFRRSAPRAGFARPIEELAARGELDSSSPGRIAFRGPARRLLEHVDGVARGWAAELGARKARFPGLLPAATLSRAGRPVIPRSPARVPPAVCYHVYGEWQGERLETAPVLLTARGRCSRDEEAVEPSMGRLRDFQMREIVALGSRADVEAFRQGLLRRASRLVTELDLEGRIETASDPFFLEGGAREDAEARGRGLMQQVLPLKYELRLALDARGRTTAVASFNHHLRFFGRRFDIRLASGGAVHSGCVALGLERWALAFMAQHGTDPRGWPAAVRDACAREDERARLG